MARLIYYASVCAALPVLRRKSGVPEAKFLLPLGNIFVVLAIAVSLLLFPKLDRRGLLVLGVLAVCIVANSLWAERQGHPSTTQN